MDATLNGLGLFDPIVADWFRTTLGEPTLAQKESWPLLAGDKHLLLTSPTGSGKTLAAFLVAIDRFLKEDWELGATRVLYVSPLKALNNDIQRNLITPLEQLQDLFSAEGRVFPQIRVMTRSGDTPQAQRREMLRHPPEILITTPESLNIMLTSKSGQQILRSLHLVILDEIHAVIGNKRGVHLITAVERLTLLSGEFQRLALSATIGSMEEFSRWLGGQGRTVAVVDAKVPKKIDFAVSFKRPDEDEVRASVGGENPVWRLLAKEALAKIQANNSTLVFANSRRIVERVARLINLEAGEQLVFAHHGSLSREIREVVEQRLKRGELKGIVATNSLELGIDIGSIDEVLLLQAPPAASAALQRIGRSGHGVGQTSRAVLYPTHPMDVLESAVLAGAVDQKQIEPLVPEEAALDVLAQLILSLTVHETLATQDIYDFVRTSYPYAHLSLELFDLIIEMLAGKYEDSRLAVLRPRLELDRITNQVTARKGTERLLYSSGGTIPDRGYFKVRMTQSNAVVGELDEEFVWERTNGDTITLGVQSWKIDKISFNDVFVSPSRSATDMAPFWKSERRVADWWTAERTGDFLEFAESSLKDPSFPDQLETQYRLDAPAREALVNLLGEQKEQCGHLPHRRRVLVEHIGVHSREGRVIYVFHTVWGGRINRAFVLAVEGVFGARKIGAIHTEFDDYCALVDVPAEVSAGDVIAAVSVSTARKAALGTLGSSGVFGARFRENAGRALLLPRRGFNRRVPLWQTRKRSKELFDGVAAFDDFPLMLETYRSCLREEVDLDGLEDRLAELADGSVALEEVFTDLPSPFAKEVFYRRTNELMYDDDTPEGAAPSLKGDLVREVAASPYLRPRVEPGVIQRFVRKLKRLEEGYAPDGPRELLVWIKERLFMGEGEWRELLSASAIESDTSTDELCEGVQSRALALRLKSGTKVILAVEDLPKFESLAEGNLDGRLGPVDLGDGPLGEPAAEALRLARAQYSEPEDRDDLLAGMLGEWLRFWGPLGADDIHDLWPLPAPLMDKALVTLVDGGQVVSDIITAGGECEEYCDLENLTRLLRFQRAGARPTPGPRPARELPSFLAVHQRLGLEEGSRPELAEVFESLFGYPAKPALWEDEFLPPRAPSYGRAALDGLMREFALQWEGAGGDKIYFALQQERELFCRSQEDTNVSELDLKRYFPEEAGRFSVEDLVLRSKGRSLTQVKEQLLDWASSGLVSCDSLEPLLAKSKAGPKIGAAPRRRGSSIAGRSRWRSGSRAVGHWFKLAPP